VEQTSTDSADGAAAPDTPDEASEASEAAVWARLAVLERDAGVELMSAAPAPDGCREFELYVLGRAPFLRWQAALDATTAGQPRVDPDLGTTTWYAVAEHEGWTYRLIGVEKTTTAADRLGVVICKNALQTVLQHSVASFSGVG
jgi:hypothetical protein